MVLLFELFLLRGTYTWIDREVGWGAFPLCDNNFNALEGKFKCPFLRGHYDSKIDRFKKIENFISQDLDHWLCNLYFQVCTKKKKKKFNFLCIFIFDSEIGLWLISHLLECLL